MHCPHSTSPATKEQRKKTILGSRTFRCTTWKHLFHERTGPPFTFLEYPTEVVFLVVLWRLRDKLSLRDVAEMFGARGFLFPHETVRDWETRFAPLLADQFRKKRRGQDGGSWYVDETSLKVHGKWCSLYRAIDQEGNLVDSFLSEKRDMEAAQRFFRQAPAPVSSVPEQITTDGHTSSPRAIRETMGETVQHRTNTSLNNLLEQDHRGIKQRYSPMHGFQNVESAARFCRTFDEGRQSFRSHSLKKEIVSLAERRRFFCQRFADLQILVGAASSLTHHKQHLGATANAFPSSEFGQNRGHHP